MRYFDMLISTLRKVGIFRKLLLQTGGVFVKSKAFTTIPELGNVPV